MNPTHFGGNASVQSHKTCVVYDHSSGNIRHMHSVITLKGGIEPTAHEIEAAALRHASKLNKQGGNLKVLHVDHSTVLPGRLYRVDTKAMKLVERSPN